MDYDWRLWVTIQCIPMFYWYSQVTREMGSWHKVEGKSPYAQLESLGRVKLRVSSIRGHVAYMLLDCCLTSIHLLKYGALLLKNEDSFLDRVLIFLSTLIRRAAEF